MVGTEEQWHRARRLRSNGHTLAQISEKTGISVSTLSYRFIRRRESNVDEGPIRIIEIISFKPMATVVSLSPFDFEKNRISNQLYSSGFDLYEDRHGIFHHTRLPETPVIRFRWGYGGLREQSFAILEDHKRLFYGTDYPLLAEVIENDPNWNNLILSKPYLDRFLKKYVQHLSYNVLRDDAFLEVLKPVVKIRLKKSTLGRNEFLKKKIRNAAFWAAVDIRKASIESMLPDMPVINDNGEMNNDEESPVDLLLYMHNNSLTPIKALKRYIDKAKEIKKKFERHENEIYRSDFLDLVLEQLDVEE